MKSQDYSQIHPVWKFVIPPACILIMYLCLVHPFVQSVREDQTSSDDDEFVDPTEESNAHDESTPDSSADGEADGNC